MTLINKIFFLLGSKLKKKFYLIFFLVLISSLLEMIGIGFVIPIAGLLSDSSENLFLKKITGLFPFKNLEKNELITIVMVTFFLFYITKAVFLTFSIWLQSKFNYNLMNEIYKKLITKYLSHNFLYWADQDSSNKIKILTQEINLVSSHIVQPCLIIMTELFVILAILSLLFYHSVVATLFCIFFTAISFVLWQKISSPKIKKNSLLRSQYDSLLFKQIQETLLGIKDIKMYGCELASFKNLENNLSNIKTVKTQHDFITNIPKIYLELIAVICFSFFMIIFLNFFPNIVSIIPTLALFAAAAFKLMPSANRLMLSAQNIKYGMIPLNIVVSELKNKNFSEDSLNNSLDQIAFLEKINISNIFFNYKNSKKFILHHINFEIKKGEKIGIIGQSGSGKTTFVDILSGLIDPDSGKILVDNVDINKNIRNWREKIGYIQQNTYLMNDTIKNNITFGTDHRLENFDFRLNNAIKVAHLDNLIHELPMGIEAMIGERGIKLSGGQRQRIGIARAIYKNPEILILDESTNSLDSETEKKILENFKNLQGEKTILIISHNRESLRYCDKIIKIEKGNLKEVLLKK